MLLKVFLFPTGLSEFLFYFYFLHFKSEKFNVLTTGKKNYWKASFDLIDEFTHFFASCSSFYSQHLRRDRASENMSWMNDNLQEAGVWNLPIW